MPRGTGLFTLFALAGILTVAGCGGGSSSSSGGSNNNGNGNGNTSPAYASRVSGSVTDGNGGAIVGATVTVNGYPAVTTTQFGQYSVSNVLVPAGQNTLITTIKATATVNGQPWSGQNTFTAQRGTALTTNVNLSLSQTSTQGTVSGQVVNSATKAPLAGVYVSIADGPYGTAPGQYFSVASPYTAYTDSNGNYTIPTLPPFTNYTVTASSAGYINATSSNVTVTTGKTTHVNLALTPSSTFTGPIQPVTGLGATAITLPVTPTRAAADPRQQSGLMAIKYALLTKLGYLNHQTADSTKISLSRSTSRAAPSGSIVESVVIWDYAPFTNLLGYDVLRSTADLTHFGSIAIVQDPLADRYEDDDPALTPDTIYSYSVARLDTIGYPQNPNDEGTAPNAVSVEPLDPLSLVAPASESTVTGAPTFQWSSVNRNNVTYTVMVYNQFPNYQSDTDPNAVKPIWTSSATANTSIAYGGPTLVSGQTYYWVALAQDAPAADFSISPIQSFVAQ